MYKHSATGGSSGVTLEKILKFITGQSSIPPRGLKNSTTIGMNPSHTQRLSVASQLSLFQLLTALTLDFANAMDKGILWSGDQFLRE